MRNPHLDIKLSVEKNMVINQNSIVQLRKQCLMKNFKQVRIRLREDDSKVSFEGYEIVLGISYTNTKVLPSAQEYLSHIVEELVRRKASQLPNGVTLQDGIENEST
jgi:hypothetical protein